MQILFQINSAASCNTLLSCYFSSISWAKILPSKTVIPPYDSPPTRSIGQLTPQASKGKFTSHLTFLVIFTDQPALLSTEASIALDVLTMHADFIRKCSISNPPQPLLTEPDSHQESAAGPPLPPPDTSMRVWPTLRTWTLELISKNWTSLFQGLGFPSLLVDLDLDPDVKPIHAPIQCEPISKLDAIKAALDAYETTGQLVRVSQPRAKTNPNQTGKNTELLRTFLDPQ